MAIPPLDAAGRLPAGRYVTDVVEVEERFVAPFPLSLTRPSLYSGWRDRRRAIVAMVATIDAEWVGGSFASGKRDPSDLDVVTFLDAGSIRALPVAERASLDDIAQGRPITRHAGTHGWLVSVYPPDVPEYGRYVRARDFWDRDWSSDYGETRGYLDVRGDA